MVLDPYSVTKQQINSVWESKQWEFPTGFVQAYRLPGTWSPYESIDFLADQYHIFFCHEKWTTVGLTMEGATDELVINPPLLLIFARGQGDTPADVILTGREAADTLAGVLNVLLGHGYPILMKAYEAVFRKDRKETIKYYPGRTRVGMTGVTKDELVRVLKPVANGVLEHLPANVKVALRWYAKGISEDNPIDKFFSLYECSLAIVSRWHYSSYPDAYEEREAPPRRMFGDWVRDVLNPQGCQEEQEKFRPFDAIVDTRNRIFKANDLEVRPDKVSDVVSCATQTLLWALSVFLPQSHLDSTIDYIDNLET